MILLKATHFLDPRSGIVLSPAAILIEYGKITEVGSPAQIHAPSNAQALDLGGSTLLPSLIDGHTHPVIDEVIPAEAELNRRWNAESEPDMLLAIVESPEKRVLMGVKFAAGSDMYLYFPGKTRGEASATMFTALHHSGMPPLDIIRAVTANAAEMLGWHNRIGTIEPGKLRTLSQ
ncbi:amidohydrolase family protein [Bradyrhizobium sp. C-145]|uniref:amidohydrolase family protein n=1 Tax=Bradyrhizobium sp. C-145 TaxID=574727 RepID=UPI00201B631D|nr:amidohydrolase family protein [Bradyrhizobium sp. C-145]UQR61529.1 amidohydrolase family protein [Bradyrhizobium sp. C-145]